MPKQIKGHSESPHHDATRVPGAVVQPCPVCLEGRPYVCCPKRECALQAMVEQRGNMARGALVALLDMLDDCNTEAGFRWTKKDRREFLKQAGMQ